MYEIHYYGKPIKKFFVSADGVSIEFATSNKQKRIRTSYPGDAHAIITLLTFLGENDMQMQIVEVND